MAKKILTNDELLELAGNRITVEIVSPTGSMTVEGCLAPAESGIETYVLYHHGIETQSMLPHEIVVSHSPIYSKEQYSSVSKTVDELLAIVQQAEEKGVYELLDLEKLSSLSAEVNWIPTTKGEHPAPSLRLSKGTPLWIEDETLQMNFVGLFSTTYATLVCPSHNRGADALTAAGMPTRRSILR